MSPENFVYWCHGWSEINGGAAPTPAQWQIIVDHLAIVKADVVLVTTSTYCTPTYEPIFIC